MTRAQRLVWDLPIRLVHWALLATVVGSYVTDLLGPAWFAWHVACGCMVLVLVAFRIVWGFVGTRHARFTSFVRGPAVLMAYLRPKRIPDTSKPMAGHNPLGGLGIVIMLVLLLAQAGTGLFANDDIDNAGPFFGWVSDGLSNRLTSVHHFVFKLLEMMIGLHVGAVLFYLFVKRRNLVTPMLTGRKDAGSVPPGEELHGSRPWLALLLLAILALLLLWALRLAPPVSFSAY